MASLVSGPLVLQCTDQPLFLISISVGRMEAVLRRLQITLCRKQCLLLLRDSLFESSGPLLCLLEAQLQFILHFSVCFVPIVSGFVVRLHERCLGESIAVSDHHSHRPCDRWLLPASNSAAPRGGPAVELTTPTVLAVKMARCRRASKSESVLRA